MVVSGLFITDLKGKILISRNYRGDIPISAIESFSERLHEAQLTDKQQVEPIFIDNNISFMHIKRNDLYIVAVTNLESVSSMSQHSTQVATELATKLGLNKVSNRVGVNYDKPVNATSTLVFLNKLCAIFIEYFGVVSEEIIRDNFVLIYELLDEVMDFGYPQTTEHKILKEYITQEINLFGNVSINAQKISRGKLKFKDLVNSKSKSKRQPKVPIAATNAVSWRSEGIKHRKNEVFLDVIEKLNLLVSKSGEVLHSEILGAVKMKSFLSGMPELKLGLNDRTLFKKTGRKGKSVLLEDLKFHQCVRLARFENDRTISFIPPDGEFELLTYRINTNNKSEDDARKDIKPLIWVEAVIEPHSHSRIEYLIKAKSQFKSRSVANNVKISVPVPSDVDSPSFKANIGSVTYVPDKDAVVWSIKHFNGGKEYLMRAHFGLPSTNDVSNLSWKKPATVSFEMPYFTVSGIQVRYLKIVDKSGYQALPWVRYITQNGDYQLRLN